ncbi:DDE-domain-containing protein [Didymella exigua CBS 183.55]|uniref:DDE-domain-containing protein n=1 Tax=Didymella exigua CBS 183.55 TaxID=1150837 RepID=A0A6A5RJA6_9PLEO|nr:DDE-domain-containing protein [Didymella exigua CBS 183.55]KAF1927188.1 DDE-domain-containing protein [Didymella exigua CBS 183.55]
MKFALGHPVQTKFLPSIAFSVARQRKPIDWNRHDKYIYKKISHWFKVIKEVLEDPAVVPENVYNMDKTGVMLSMLSSVKVLVGKDDERDYRGAGVKRTMTTYPTPGWHYAYSENGYNDSKISLEWLTRVFDPQTRAKANRKPRVLISDGFGTHETLEILEFGLENNIILCRLPSHTSHKVQPCDVAVFAALKAAYRDQVYRLGRGGVHTIGKEDFTSLYSPARVKAFTKRNITQAWAATGHFPFNPDRVLRGIPKPHVQLTAQMTDTPVTPVTPVNTGAVTLLYNMIKQDAEGLDEPRKQRIHRRVQKLASATRVAFAERSLLQNHNRFLSKINGEVKARQSQRSLVLRVAKVMSAEDLEERRAKRAAEDKAVAGKAKRWRKRKNTLKNGGEEFTIGVTPPAASPGPWRAPVARMIAGDRF